ncbi:MAG: hypothetical protein WAK55_00860, partial [Xanthobacteraceae bacterium]
MTDQQQNTGAAGSSPSPAPAPGGNSFIRDRARQMSETTMRPAMPAQDPVRPEDNRAALDQRSQQQQQQQQ